MENQCEEEGEPNVTKKTYRCGCGAWMEEGCEWSGPLSEMVVIAYTPESVRETATASGRMDTGLELVAVCRDCWRYIQQQDAFDPDWWEETTADPAFYAEECDEDLED